jgi:hypothetical protein
MSLAADRVPVCPNTKPHGKMVTILLPIRAIMGSNLGIKTGFSSFGIFIVY